MTARPGNSTATRLARERARREEAVKLAASMLTPVGREALSEIEAMIYADVLKWGGVALARANVRPCRNVDLREWEALDRVIRAPETWWP